ncbi:MAG: hypothetical protein GX602_04430, partial [Dehalococcoidales bacterium]|nr:hypothetical protein [Dehalococcoidales bacterium]
MIIMKSTQKNYIYNRGQKLLANVLVLIMLFSITAGYVYASDPVIIESSAVQRNYFQYLNASGEWNDLDRRDHGVVSTGAVAYCMNAGDDSPHPFHSFSPGEDIFTTFGFGNFSIGLENIFFYGFPSTSPSVHSLTDRQARYATAMAISCFLSENGYDQGSDFYNLSAGTLRPDGTPEGQATWDYFIYLLTYARAANPISRSVSVTPTTDTYIDGSYYARSYRVTATNCNSGYTIDSASLPSGYEILGYTGTLGETITVRIPATSNANTPFSFTAIGWDNRTAANLIIQDSTTAGIQTMMYQSLLPAAGARDNGNIEGEDIDIDIEKIDLATGARLQGAEITVWTDSGRTNVFRSVVTDANGY